MFNFLNDEEYSPEKRVKQRRLMTRMMLALCLVGIPTGVFSCAASIRYLVSPPTTTINHITINDNSQVKPAEVKCGWLSWGCKGGDLTQDRNYNVTTPDK